MHEGEGRYSSLEEMVVIWFKGVSLNHDADVAVTTKPGFIRLFTYDMHRATFYFPPPHRQTRNEILWCLQNNVWIHIAAV